MSRVRLASLALFVAATTFAACAAPTAPAPAAPATAPSYFSDPDTSADSDTASRSGYQVGNG